MGGKTKREASNIRESGFSDRGNSYDGQATGWRSKEALMGQKYDYSRHRKRKAGKLSKAQDQKFARFEQEWGASSRGDAKSNTNFEGLYGKDFADQVLKAQTDGRDDYTAGRFNDGNLERLKINDLEGASNYIRSRRTISDRLSGNKGFKGGGGGNVFSQKKRKTAFSTPDAGLEGGLYGA